MTTKGVRRLRRFFFLIFTLSICVIIYVGFFRVRPSGGAGPSGGPQALVIDNPLITLAPLLTAAIAFFGLIITTIVSVRKEKREARAAILDNQKKELEIEKLKTELTQLKNKGLT